MKCEKCGREKVIGESGISRAPFCQSCDNPMLNGSWVRNIIREKLIEIGAHGLCGDECGCCLADLMPCDGECFSIDCIPAVNNEKLAAEEGTGFWMQPMRGY